MPARIGDIRRVNRMQTKIFTPKEANELIPVITPLLREMQEEQSRINAIGHELRLFEIITSSNITMSSESAINEKRNAYNHCIFQMNVLLSRIQEYGCLVKDIDMGLVDFLAEIEGRRVFLCWKLGEDNIKYYHELNDGFQGRKFIWFE